MTLENRGITTFVQSTHSIISYSAFPISSNASLVATIVVIIAKGSVIIQLALVEQRNSKRVSMLEQQQG
jgi:hypothetical protein